MTQGGGGGRSRSTSRPTTTAPGCSSAAGIVLALLARARGRRRHGGGRVAGADRDRLPVRGRGGAGRATAALRRRVGPESGAARRPGCHLYERDGRVGDGVLRHATHQRAALRAGARIDGESVGRRSLAATVGALTRRRGADARCGAGMASPSASSVHPSRRSRRPAGAWPASLLRRYRHPAAGRFVQVGIPLSLSVDAPAVKGPAPTPAPVRRRVKTTAAPATTTRATREDRPRAGDRTAAGGRPRRRRRGRRARLRLGGRDDERPVLVVGAGRRALGADLARAPRSPSPSPATR